ncbi:hypothetical protein KFU94_33115 [Chloroflexi bacterium TSY]|nr:hypothetical protein [Chloroflexi bacterium TSY]
MFKNNVTRFLDNKRVAYQVYQYDYESGVQSAVEVAEAIGLPPEQVFKTLVTLLDGPKSKPMLVVMPGPDILNLKNFAKAIKAKKVKMASHEQAENLTGLQTGGISPLALINKGFSIYLDQRAKDFQSIAVSAGQRGVNLEIAVDDLIHLTRAHLVVL